MSLKTNQNSEEQKRKVNDLLRFARAYCVEKLPWFSPALFKCKIHLTKKVPVAAIDYSFNIYFNPEAIETIAQSGTKSKALSEVGFLWIHEISHVLREHNVRSKEKNADPLLWNITCDLEINDSNWEGLSPPEKFPGIFPSTFNLPDGQLSEFYYKKLTKDQSSEDSIVLKLPNGQKIKLDIIDEGSGVHGHSRPWEVEMEGAQEMDEIEIELIKRGVANEIKKGQKLGLLAGHKPGGWLRWAEEKLKRKVDWRTVLRHRMSVAINNGLGSRIDYSYSRPSRRQAVYHPILTPSLRGDMAARVTVIVDTSGSMTPQQIGQAVAEIFDVLKSFQVPVTVIPCDAQAYEPISVARPNDFFKLRKLAGGGGTNMIVGIEAALKLKPAPDSILVLTDGFTPYPDTKYKTAVIFGILTMTPNQQTGFPPNPPWGKDTVVEIDLSKDR